MRSTTRWTALGAGLLLTTGLTACGDGGTDVESDPTTALSEAMEALGDYDGIELTLAVDGDREAIIASDDSLDEKTADLLLDSSMVVRAAGEDENDAQAEFVINLGGQDAVEIRVLPEPRFFVRVDLEAISNAVDDPTFSDGVDEAMGAAEGFGLAELAAAVQSGDWIELTGAEQLAELAGGFGAGAEEEPSEEEVEDVRERIVGTVQGFLDEDVDVVYVGEEEMGERVTATTTEADLAALFDQIAIIAGDLSGMDPDVLGDMPETEASDRPIELDFWIDGGRLRQVGYDLSQIEGEEGAPAGTFVLATIEEFGGSVEAPSDATEIDLFAIIGRMFSGGLAGMPGDDDLDDLGELGDLGDPGDQGDPGADGGEGDPLSGDCLSQDQIDQMTGGDEAAQAELEAAVELGLLEIC